MQGVHDEVSVVGSRRTWRRVRDRTPGRCQAGFGAFFSEGGIRCFPGRTLSCPNTTWTAVVERQASAGRQAGRNGAGSAVIRGVGSRRGCVVARLAGHRMPARRMTGGRDRLRDRQDDKTGRGAALVLRSRTGATCPRQRRARRQGLAYFFIMSKNSALVLVTRILSRMNSMDCTSSMSWMNLRSTRPSAAGPARSAALRGGCRTCSG